MYKYLKYDINWLLDSRVPLGLDLFNCLAFFFGHDVKSGGGVLTAREELTPFPERVPRETRRMSKKAAELN